MASSSVQTTQMRSVTVLLEKHPATVGHLPKTAGGYNVRICVTLASKSPWGDALVGEATLEICNIELKQANEFVALHHRHHKPVQGHRFSIGLCDNGKLIGVVIVGRPVARLAPNRTVEVTRLCTDGTPNACSMLYSAGAKAAKALGYKRIQTYILQNEHGISLKASGWTNEGPAGGGQWKHTDGKPRRIDQPTELKERWAKAL